MEYEYSCTHTGFEIRKTTFKNFLKKVRHISESCLSAEKLQHINDSTSL